ncbi:MAG TPA: ATP-binding protein, partial [Aggregatilineales bacterium]|nr:ATP-binding protein [Aggregatilineales bacterium]
TPDGQIIAASSPLDVGKIVSRQSYFESSLNADTERHFHPPFYEVGSQELALYSTYQIRNQSGQVVNVLAVDLDLSRLGEIMIERTGLPETGETYLVSRQNNYLLTPSRFEGYIPTRAYRSTGIDRALGGDSGNDIYDGYRGTTVMGVYRWIPELEAGLVAEVEKQEAMAEVVQTRNTTLLASVAAMLVAALFGLGYAAYVSRPIINLTRAAVSVAGGDYTQHVEVNRSNEIGQLGHAFNTMTSELKRTITDLQDLNENLEFRVAARTRDLQIASDVSQQVTRVLDPKILLPNLVEFTRAGFDFYHVSVFLFDEATDTLQLEAGSGDIGHEMLQAGKRFNLLDKHGLVPLAARDHQPVIINDVTQSSNHRPNPLLPDTRSEAALPMVVGTRLIGVLDLQSVRENHFQPEDVRILTALSDQIAIAVRNAQLYTEAEEGRQAAEEANQIKSQFLANMSHELRTPLNAILNFTAFVADEVMGPVNEEQQEALQQTISSSKHLLALINDVLDITKIEAGMMELFIQEVDLNEVLAVTVAVAKGLVKDKPVELITDIEEHLPHTSGDKRRLRQVFLNLVSNAVKFTPEGSITLRAYMENSENVHVMVIDSGIGIAEDDHNMVFESFKQAKHDLPEAVGTGLGMPITKFFVESHEGKIWFESALDMGTTFHVLLPVRTEAIVRSENNLAEVV